MRLYTSRSCGNGRRGVKKVLQVDRRKAGAQVSLPIVRSKRPGTVALDNAVIYDIAFP